MDRSPLHRSPSTMLSAALPRTFFHPWSRLVLTTDVPATPHTQFTPRWWSNGRTSNTNPTTSEDRRGFGPSRDPRRPSGFLLPHPIKTYNRWWNSDAIRPSKAENSTTKKQGIRTRLEHVHRSNGLARRRSDATKWMHVKEMLGHVSTR